MFGAFDDMGVQPAVTWGVPIRVNVRFLRKGASGVMFTMDTESGFDDAVLCILRALSDVRLPDGWAW